MSIKTKNMHWNIHPKIKTKKEYALELIGVDNSLQKGKENMIIIISTRQRKDPKENTHKHTHTHTHTHTHRGTDYGIGGAVDEPPGDVPLLELEGDSGKRITPSPPLDIVETPLALAIDGGEGGEESFGSLRLGTGFGTQVTDGLKTLEPPN
jgi:hypothetical protein